jgi:curved DNA-binding protein CbpA
MKTLYDLIGARRDDDAESLKKAYRKAVKANHPDHHADDPEAVRRFIQITAAYDILRDTEQRVAYDWTLESCRKPPNALRHTAPPRRRFFVSSMSVSAAVTLMLSGAYLVFARVSGVSIEEVVGRRAPQANATAAVQPAVPQMPIMVAGTSVATSTAQDRSASEETKDGTASQETKDWTASTETRNTAPSEETKDRTASMETQSTAPSEETKDWTASTETPNTAPSEETKDGTASQETAPAQARRAIYVAKQDVDMDLGPVLS